jgi:hypothetical protein
VAIFFSILTHLLIIISVFALSGAVVFLISSPDHGTKIVIRIISAVVGVFIYIGAKGIGLSLTELIMLGVQLTSPLGFGLSAVLLPSATGVIVAWYFINQLRKSEDIAARIMILIMSFIVIMFGDVYVATYSVSDNFDGYNRALLPNLSFIIGLAIYIILNYEVVENKFEQSNQQDKSS